MPVLQEFVGGMYQALSSVAAADLAVNLFAETRRVEGGSKTRWLLGSPGRTFLSDPPAVGGCRGIFHHDGLTLAVIGDRVYRVVVATGVCTEIGTIAVNNEPCSFASNGQGGNQVVIVGGNEVKVYSTTTGTLTTAALPFSGPVQVVYMDGYFLINQRNTAVIWYSALEDGTSWDALDFVTRFGTSDNIVGIGTSQSNIWVFGTKTSTMFYNSGDADTPFLPYPGSTVQIGAITPWAIGRHRDVFLWLSQDANGTAQIVKATGGLAATVVSTPPIETWLRSCSTLETAEALVYAHDGHVWFVLTCPGSPDDIKTYGWDDTEGLWSARAGWDEVTGRFTRWRARGCYQVDQQIVVGDYTTSVLCTLDLEKGLMTAPGEVPLVDLRISRDGAKTWISAGAASMGVLGDYDGPGAVWRRLGRVRADRLVLEISYIDYADNGALTRRVRRTPYLSGEPLWIFLDRVELAGERGCWLGLSLTSHTAGQAVAAAQPQVA